MTIRDAMNAAHARVLVGEDRLDEEILAACGSDMMSDVLAFVKDQAMLVTGLCNPQVIRTAEMIDMKCVLFVRDKNPTQDMLELAEEAGIVVLKTGHRMFNSCGLLYEGVFLSPWEYAKKLGMDAIHPHYSEVLLSSDECTAAHAAGIQVNPWTVNAPEIMDAVLSKGVDILITNFPDQALKRTARG